MSAPKAPSPGIYATFKKTLEDYGLVDFFSILTLIYAFVAGVRHPEAFGLVMAFFLALVPIVLPFLLWSLFKYSWMTYVQQDKHWNRREYVLLEIVLPEEITQTPYAMELVLRSMYQTGEIDTPIDQYWKGHVKPWFSLEIASIEGKIHFYIWTWKQFKNYIESQIYAHYPTVEVREVPDYTLLMPYSSNLDIWGIEQKLQKPDPYPITTYVEVGLDKQAVKEEFKHDPLLSILEFFGTLGKGEHAWMQLIIRAHTVASWSEEKLGHAVKIDEWAKVIIEGMLASTAEEGKRTNFSALSEGKKEEIKAIETKLNKQMFDVGIRMMYVAKKEHAVGSRKVGFPTAMRSFEHGAEGRGLNGFKPIFKIGPFNYPWQDYFGIRKKKKQHHMYEGYVRRQYYYPPFGEHWIALNVEEIATVFHFPGKVARTPNLTRLTSKRGEAPANLPL